METRRKKLKPLKLSQKNCRSRWLVLGNWNVLHRIAEIRWGDHPDYKGNPPEEELRAGEQDKIYGMGRAICGASGHFMMPGVFSRMGLPRCKHCCRIMGIPNGDGCPYNQDILEPGDKLPEEESKRPAANR